MRVGADHGTPGGQTAAAGQQPDEPLGDAARELVMVRSRLHSELADMSSSFQQISRLTRAAGRRAPVARDAASADELISAWEAHFRGVCEMVLQCGRDDLLANSRAQERKRVQLPKPDHDVLESNNSAMQIASAERRCKLLEEQVSKLKGLFELQWTQVRQVQDEIVDLEKGIASSTRDFEKARFESSQQFWQMKSVCHERDELEQQASRRRTPQQCQSLITAVSGAR